MKKVFLSLFFLFFASFGFGQANSKLDSLKRVLAKLPAEGKSFAGDTLRVRILCEMGTNSFLSLGDSAKGLLEQSLKISNTRNWKKGLMLSHMGLGLFYSGKNQQMQAIDYLYKSLSNCDNGDPKRKAQLFRFLGDSYSLLGDFEKAIDFNTKSIELYKDRNDIYNVIHGYNNLGLVYFDKLDYKTAISVLKKGLVINSQFGNKNLDSYLRINLGFSYLKDGQLDLGYNTLINYLDPAKNKIDYSTILIYVSIADYFLQKGKINKAKEQLNLAKKIIERYKSVDDSLFEFSEVSYRVYKKNNEPQKALFFLEQYQKLKELKTSQTNKQKIDALQFEFDNLEKEKEIHQLNLTKKLGTSILIIFAFIGLGLFLLNTKLRKTNLIINNQKAEIERANKKLEGFNIQLEQKVSERTIELSQANKELVLKNFEITEALFKGQTIERKRVAAELHDNLGSTLSALNWRLSALESENLNPKEKAIYSSIKGMMSNAYNDVRNISHNLLPVEFETNGLVGALEKYISDLNENGKIKFTFRTGGTLNRIDQKVALELYSISMELITNILKHSGATEAEVFLGNRRGKLSLEIKDNGIGFRDNKTDGKGMRQITERLAAIGGKVDFRNNNGFFVKISLRIIYS